MINPIILSRSYFTFDYCRMTTVIKLVVYIIDNIDVLGPLFALF